MCSVWLVVVVMILSVLVDAVNVYDKNSHHLADRWPSSLVSSQHAHP